MQSLFKEFGLLEIVITIVVLTGLIVLIKTIRMPKDFQKNQDKMKNIK